MFRSIGMLNFSKPAIFFILSAILFIKCDYDSFDEIKNPNSKEYKKLEVDQENSELRKIEDNSVKERRIYSKFTENIIKSGGKEVLAETIRFDNKGDMKEQYRYSSTAVNVQWLYDYDEYGNLKSVEEYDGYQGLIKRTVYNFRSNGLLLDKMEEFKNNTIYYEYDYDENLNLINVNLLDRDKVLYSKYLYKYSDGKRDSIEFYRNNKISAKFIFAYDSLGRIKNETVVSKVNPARVVNYGYDERNNLIYIDNEKLTKIEYKYDANNDIIEEIVYNSAKELQSKTTFQYDSATGLLASKTRYDGLERPALEIRFEYDYY